jgi:hypothetical protein
MATSTPIDQTDAETVNWIVGWLIIIVLLFAVSKTRAGYAFVYYALLLIVILLFLTQARFIYTDMILATSVGPPQGGVGGSTKCSNNNGTCTLPGGLAGICENGVCKQITGVQQNTFDALTLTAPTLGAAGIITVA